MDHGKVQEIGWAEIATIATMAKFASCLLRNEAAASNSRPGKLWNGPNPFDLTFSRGFHRLFAGRHQIVS